MDAAEQWEPDEALASRPVLRARGGEIPPRDSPHLSLQKRRGGAGTLGRDCRSFRGLQVGAASTEDENRLLQGCEPACGPSHQKFIHVGIQCGDIKRQVRPSPVSLTGPDVPISAALATSLALVLHEFATNSAKYGALSSLSGHVDIACFEKNEVFTLLWTERGGPRINAQPASEGFGSQLARATIVGRLGGELSHE